MKFVLIIVVCGWFSLSAFGQARSEDPAKQRITEKVSELKSVKGYEERTAKLEELTKRASEEDLHVLYSFYSYLKQTRKADDIKDLALKKYPKSELAYNKRIEIATGEKELERKEKLYNQIVKDFPGQEPSGLAASLATGFSAKGDKKRMLEYFARAKNTGSSQLLITLVQGLAKSNPKEAEPMLTYLIDSLKKTMPASPAFTSSERRNSPQNTYYALHASYVLVLLANGKKEEGYKLADELKKQTGGNHAGIASAYLLSLIANGKYNDAFPLMTAAFTNGTATPEVKDRAKKVYTAVQGSSNGFDAYITKLEKQRMELVVNTISKKAIAKPSADFMLKDLDGKTVSLSELRGKVVVLDFWATWCVPCKASFPMMQKTVNKYRNDPQVKFLFIHTWEQEETAPEDAKKYLDDNKFTFQVLMDMQDAGTRHNKVVDSYAIQGLPTKVVIDPQGNVCFQVSGFGNAGGDEGQVEELSGMIEYARRKG